MMHSRDASTRTLVSTAGALLALLAATCLAAQIHLGAASDLLAIAIAAAKSALVAAVFMHLKWSSGLTRIFAAAGVFWLLILMSLALTDYLTRPVP